MPWHLFGHSPPRAGLTVAPYRNPSELAPGTEQRGDLRPPRSGSSAMNERLANSMTRSSTARRHLGSWRDNCIPGDLQLDYWRTGYRWLASPYWRHSPASDYWVTQYLPYSAWFREATHTFRKSDRFA
jgi:hypothetical protein